MSLSSRHAPRRSPLPTETGPLARGGEREADRGRRGRARELAAGLLFISPWLLGFLVFTLYPIFASLYLSFTDYRVLAPPRWVGLENYTSLLTDTDYFWPSLANTIYLFLELPLALILGLAMA